MASAEMPHPPHPLWVEAAGIVQADHDADVRLEARGLAVAEMADVTFGERIAALLPGSHVAVLIRNQERMTGKVAQSGADFLVLRAPQPVLIPVSVISTVSSLPRVLHDESTTTRGVRTVTWRSILRELLGETMQIDASGVRHAGRLTWVGADHVSLMTEGATRVEVTIRWSRIDLVSLPPTWDRTTEPR